MHMPHRCLRRVHLSVGVSLALALGAATPSAFAQTGADAAMRRELVEQAQRARSANDHTRALDLAVRASSLQMTPSLRMFIAEEQASLNLFADALNNAEMCSREAERDAASPTHTAVMNACRQLAQTVRPRVARVSVQIPPPAPAGLRVTIAGHDLNSALYGVPYMVNPGAIVVEATADGMRPVHREVTVAAGASLDVALAFEQGPGAAQPVSAASTGPSGSPPQIISARLAPPTHDSTPPPSGPGAGPWVFVGGGVVVMALSGVFYLLRIQTVTELERTCFGPGNLLCPPESAHFIESAQRWTTLSGIALGVGAAATASGLLWFALAPRANGTRREHARIDIVPMPGGAMAGLSGSF